MLEKTKSPSDYKEIKPVSPKGNQSWIFIGRTDVGAETPKFWPPDVKNRFLEKNLMLGKIEGRRRRGWQRMRWLDGITDYGHEFVQTLGAGNGQGSLAYCSPWGHKESDVTKQLNWTELAPGSQIHPLLDHLSFHICFGLIVYIPPQILMLGPTSQCESIWRWDLQAKIRSSRQSPHKWN